MVFMFVRNVTYFRSSLKEVECVLPVITHWITLQNTHWGHLKCMFWISDLVTSKGHNVTSHLSIKMGLSGVAWHCAYGTTKLSCTGYFFKDNREKDCRQTETMFIQNDSCGLFPLSHFGYDIVFTEKTTARVGRERDILALHNITRQCAPIPLCFKESNISRDSCDTKKLEQ